MIYLNDVIEHHVRNCRYRVVGLYLQLNEAWLFPLSGTNPVPLLAKISELEELLDGTRASIVKDCDEPAPVTVSPASLKKRDKAHASILPLIDSREIFIPATRNRLINERAQELGCSERTILRTLRTFWAGGMTKNSLIPKFHKRGVSTTQASIGIETKQRGRRPKYEDRQIYQITNQDRQAFRSAIETLYLKGKTATI